MGPEVISPEEILKIAYEGKPLRIALSQILPCDPRHSKGDFLEVRIDNDTSQIPEELTRYRGQTSLPVRYLEGFLHIELNCPEGPKVRFDAPEGTKALLEAQISRPFVIPPRTRVTISLFSVNKNKLAERVIEINATNPTLLGAYYAQEQHRTKYTTFDVFNHLFHKTRIEILRPIFRQYIKPGSTVADIGSGQSIFLTVDHPQPIRLIAFDLDLPMLQNMARQVDQIAWVASSATDLPLSESSLDAIYAGEIIEHVTDTQKTLDSWSDLLKPGGILILTTPNRKRLSNLLSTYDRPCNPEHISEMAYDELLAALDRAGFRVLMVRGIYIELFLSYWRKLKSDLLAFRMRWRIMWPVFWFLMHLGRLFPRYAFNLTVVAKKT